MKLSVVARVCELIEFRISQEIGFRRFSARLVAKLLHDDQKSAQVRIFQLLRTRSEEEREAFLLKIVTCDETSVHHYTPKSKRESMEWRKKSDENIVKAKTRLFARKILNTIFWTYHQHNLLLWPLGSS